MLNQLSRVAQHYVYLAHSYSHSIEEKKPERNNLMIDTATMHVSGLIKTRQRAIEFH